MQFLIIFSGPKWSLLCSTCPHVPFLFHFRQTPSPRSLVYGQPVVGRHLPADLRGHGQKWIDHFQAGQGAHTGQTQMHRHQQQHHGPLRNRHSPENALWVVISFIAMRGEQGKLSSVSSSVSGECLFNINFHFQFLLKVRVSPLPAIRWRLPAPTTSPAPCGAPTHPRASSGTRARARRCGRWPPTTRVCWRTATWPWAGFVCPPPQSIINKRWLVAVPTRNFWPLLLKLLRIISEWKSSVSANNFLNFCIC